MDPIIAIFLIIMCFAGAGALYIEKVNVPRLQAQLANMNRIRADRLESEKLALELKKEQESALTLEDRIWLFDMGRTDWSPNDEPDVKDIIHKVDSGKSIGVWDLPDWYVDFLTTRPFLSDLADMFYKIACSGEDVKTHLAEIKQEHLAEIARKKEMIKQEKARMEKVRAERVQKIKEAEKLAKERQAQAKAEALEYRKRRATELEEKRRRNLGLTGDYTDAVRFIYRSRKWNDVTRGGVVHFPPGSKAKDAIRTLQSDHGLTTTGAVDMDTLRLMESLP